MVGGNATHEALIGVRTGQPLSREIEPHRASDGHSLVPMLLNVAEGKTGSVDIARRFWTTRGLIQREFPAREGGGESKVQRLWDMMYE